MTNPAQHISVCVCTYKRPDLLRRLLEELDHQETGGLFTYSVVVTDNDHLRSAEPVVLGFRRISQLPVRYCVEPRQGIALARNKAVENAHGDYIAFIDDDEFPTRQWLLALVATCEQYDTTAVLGPVKPHFDEDPPEWVVKGRFYERPSYPTGTVIEWRNSRTGNVLIKRQVVNRFHPPFRVQFRSGEDQDLFRRLVECGHLLVWCNEAVVYEVVPPSRWKRSYMLRRALLRGSSNTLHPDTGMRSILKSMAAVPIYAAALPAALVLGHHKFMMLLVKLCDHLGKLLALIGLNPIQEPYVTR